MSLTHKKLEHLKAFGQAVACSSVMGPADLQNVESLASTNTPSVAILSRSSLQCGNSTPPAAEVRALAKDSLACPVPPRLGHSWHWSPPPWRLAYTAHDMEWVSRGAAKCHC